MWKTHLPDNERTKRRLEQLPRIHILVKYAWYAVDSVPYAYTKVIDGDPVPMVYVFDDHNGTYAEWKLIPATYVTTGGVYCWSIHENVIKTIAEHENKLMAERENLTY